jgi:HSP20 family protein
MSKKDAPLARWPSFEWPVFRTLSIAEPAWVPAIDVFEKDNRLVTKIELPGIKKEDIRVEIADGQLAIAGERKSEVEQTQDQFYRREWAYGSFYRAVPLPDGVKLEDITATYADGVLVVSVPLPVKRPSRTHRVPIEDMPGATKVA